MDMEDIIVQIAMDTRAVQKIGSIIKCRYCGAYDAYLPLRESPFYLKHHGEDCVWQWSKSIYHERLIESTA